MPSLLELLRAYPILVNLVAVLPLGGLLNLSKTNSIIRAALHGFSDGFLEKPSLLTAVRPSLFIGRHNTSHWKSLKAKSPLCCSEPQHTRGDKVNGCLVCSMPVCQACIIKASFGKSSQNTFPNRIRSLCVECFNSGNPHQETSLNGEEAIIQTSYFRRTECICTAKGHLCLRCKTKQNSKLDSRNSECYGTGCSRSEQDGFGGRVCLWCNLPLPRERSRAGSSRDYDSRHLFAPTHSSSASEGTPSRRKVKVVAYEEQRWCRSEALRRSESGCRALLPARIPGPLLTLAAPVPIGTHFELTASILNAKDDSSLPSYESCTQ